jgi:anti-sigma B factor antagonist
LEGLELSSEHRGDSLIVVIRGDLDVVTGREFDEYLTVARRDHDRIVLDLSAVDFMDTSALAVIVGHWKGLVAAGGTLSLAGPRYRYTKSLWITGLADRLPLYDTVDKAVAAGQGDADAVSEPGDERDADPTRPGPPRKQSSA